VTLWEPGDPAIEPAAGPDDDTWSVAGLGAAIRDAVASRFPAQVWVRGEIRNLRKPNAAGHCYFDLVEPGAPAGQRPAALLSVALFRQARERVNATLKQSGTSTRMADGIEIRASVELNWWLPGGQLRLLMTGIDPVFTLGRLAEQRSRLLAKLQTEGLLDRNRAHTVPALPLRIALVTSAGSAAHADFTHELERSGFAFQVRTIDARMQGAQAAASIGNALSRAGARPVDVVALVRGGGATTDLIAFDSEQVARAIAGAAHPVFTGIGHEIDRTVADEVCHTAAKTPTACAAELVTLVAAADRQLSDRWHEVAAVGQHALDQAGMALHRAARGLARDAAVTLRAADRRSALVGERLPRLATAATVRPAAALEARAARVSREARRHLHDHDRTVRDAVRALHEAPARTLRNAEAVVTASDTTLRALDPARILARGWSITHAADGTLVRDPAQVTEGDLLVTTLAGGTVASTVTAPGEGTDVPPDP
jgi:exodeoxyribonuclease VII large subunit